MTQYMRTGAKDMKSSQQYPREFGVCVAEHHLKFMQSAAWIATVNIAYQIIDNVSGGVFFKLARPNKFSWGSYPRPGLPESN